MLRVTLEHKWVLAVSSLLLIAATYFCYLHTGTDLLPAMDEGGFTVDYIMPAGASLAETNRVITHVEKILRATPEVEGTSRRTGLQLGLAAVTEANTGDISVKLKRDRKRSADAVMADVRARINAAEPVLDVEIMQLLQDMIGDLTGAPEPVVIKLFAQDPALLNQWAAATGDAVKKIPKVKDVLNGIENTVSGPARVFTVDPVASARSGFSRRRWNWTPARSCRASRPAAPVVVNDRSYNIRVRFPQDTRHIWSHPQHPADQRHRQDRHHRFAGQMVDIPGQTEIRRDNLQRNVHVTGALRGNVNLGSGMAEVQQAVAGLKLPPDIRVEYGGTFEEQQKSFKDFAVVLVLAVVLVFIVLLFEFGNFAAPWRCWPRRCSPASASSWRCS